MATVIFRTSLILLLALGLTSCATKRYGRLQPITAAEKAAMSCGDIEVEISKVEGFRQQITEGAEIDWKSAAGFLGDFGIGNAMEKNAAEKTATERMNELLEIRSEKGCTYQATEPEVTS